MKNVVKELFHLGVSGSEPNREKGSASFFRTRWRRERASLDLPLQNIANRQNPQEGSLRFRRSTGDGPACHDGQVAKAPLKETLGGEMKFGDFNRLDGLRHQRADGALRQIIRPKEFEVSQDIPFGKNSLQKTALFGSIAND
jgi:hypothetical protein